MAGFVASQSFTLDNARLTSASFTVPAGTDQCLYIWVVYERDTPADHPSAVSYGGSAATRTIDPVYAVDSEFREQASLWVVKDPPVGTFNISVAWALGGTKDSGIIATLYDGADVPTNWSVATALSGTRAETSLTTLAANAHAEFINVYNALGNSFAGPKNTAFTLRTQDQFGSGSATAGLSMGNATAPAVDTATFTGLRMLGTGAATGTYDNFVIAVEIPPRAGGAVIEAGIVFSAGSAFADGAAGDFAAAADMPALLNFQPAAAADTAAALQTALAAGVSANAGGLIDGALTFAAGAGVGSTAAVSVEGAFSLACLAATDASATAFFSGTIVLPVVAAAAAAATAALRASVVFAAGADAQSGAGRSADAAAAFAIAVQTLADGVVSGTLIPSPSRQIVVSARAGTATVTVQTRTVVVEASKRQEKIKK